VDDRLLHVLLLLLLLQELLLVLGRLGGVLLLLLLLLVLRVRVRVRVRGREELLLLLLLLQGGGGGGGVVVVVLQAADRQLRGLAACGAAVGQLRGREGRDVDGLGRGEAACCCVFVLFGIEGCACFRRLF